MPDTRFDLGVRLAPALEATAGMRHASIVADDAHSEDFTDDDEGE